MNNLIYFSSGKLTHFDRDLSSNPYLELYKVDHWPWSLNSRTHKLDTEWDMAPTICPIPDINNSELRFDIVIEQIAEQFWNKVETTNRTPYISWSGGIDSTSILVSLLKTASADQLKKLVVLHDERSVRENAYFYHKFIRGKIRTKNINDFWIIPDNYNKILFLDGEAGNQCMGASPIHKLAYHQRFDILDSKWQDVNIEQYLTHSTTTQVVRFAVELTKQSIPYSPIPIKTVYDFLWWANFNFKFDDVLLRKTLVYTQNLTREQSRDFYNNSLVRFYSYPEMQVWTMLSKDLRRESTRVDPKFYPKQYIFEFDQNDLWFSNKREEGSYADFHTSPMNHIIAIDSDWNKYSIRDSSTRRKLGEILQRI